MHIFSHRFIDSCFNYNNHTKNKKYIKQFQDENYFESIMPQSDFHMNKKYYIDPVNPYFEHYNYDPLFEFNSY